MIKPRQFYIYIVSAISLQAFTWSLINLLRGQLITEIATNPLAMAFQIAVIIILLPVFVIHWAWAQRLAKRSKDERDAILRRVYLYGMLAIFLGSLLNNAFFLFAALISLPTGEVPWFSYPQQLPLTFIKLNFISIPVLVIMGYYHLRVIREDTKSEIISGANAVVRRIFIYSYSAVGLILSTLGIIHLIRWILYQIGNTAISGFGNTSMLALEIARLLVGVPVWVIFWLWAQRLFIRPDVEEHESVLRKIYLYGAVFISALGVVINLTGLIAGGMRLFLGVSSQGDDIRGPIASIVGLSIVWGYHAYILNLDANEVGETGPQTGIRRLYQYLIAGIGLTAIIIGLGGIVSVLIRTFDTFFGNDLKIQLSWFTAAIIAGLPLWLIPWRQLQAKAISEGNDGLDARNSLVRKIYIYFFLLITILTVISSSVYVVFRLIGAMLGEEAPSLSETSQAIAFIIIASSVAAYHVLLLRQDRDRSVSEQRQELEAVKIVILDSGDGEFANSLIDEMQQEHPGIRPQKVLLTKETPNIYEQQMFDEITSQIKSAQLIVGSWGVISGINGGSDHPAIIQLLQNSKARKLLIPEFSPGVDWVGVERFDRATITKQTIQAITQIIERKPVKPRRSLGVGAILGIIVLVLIVLSLLVSVLPIFINF